MVGDIVVWLEQKCLRRREAWRCGDKWMKGIRVRIHGEKPCPYHYINSTDRISSSKTRLRVLDATNP